MKDLFDEVNLKNLKVKNRLVRSATWEALADINGNIDDRTYKVYENLAKGGVGTIITGFTSVDSNDVYFEGMMRLSDDNLIPQYKKLVDFIHKENVKVITQLALGGFFKNGIEIEPDDMTKEDIKEVVKLFIDAAKRANQIGFDGIQIHVAHFFFLSRFISPRVNHRQDEYGGNTDNRIKLIYEIIDGIRDVAPDLHLTIKINSSDFTIGGLGEKESLEICKKLADKLDSIEVSGNGTSVAGIKAHVNEAYFLNFAKELAEDVNIPIILVGGLRSIDTMQEVLNTTKIELLSLSRPLLCEPDFPNKLKNGDTKESKCISCNSCYRTPSHICIFNR